MPLFHPRIIDKYISHVLPPTAQHVSLLNAWSANLKAGLYNSETKNDGQFIQRILVETLGYLESSTSSSWTVQKNLPVGKGNVDVALGHFSAPNKVEIIAPFELKGAKTLDLDAIMPGRGKSPVQQAWEYAMDAKGAKWVLVSNFREIRLYAIGYGRKDYESFDLLKPLDGTNYQRLMLLLSAENLIGGQTAAILAESDKKEKEITDSLYKDYKRLRSDLINTISKDNASIELMDVINYSQKILDRILFVAFAEDRMLLPPETLKKAYETTNLYAPQPVWENFKGLFLAIDKGSPPLQIPGYNGGLFAEDVGLNALSISDHLCEGFKTIGSYDFDSEVSVNILGHIFEQSIADIEEIKRSGSTAPTVSTSSGKKDKSSKRKKDGIYYTPPHVTRFIVEQAVGGWLSEKKEQIGFAALPELTDADYNSVKIVKTGKKSGSVRYNKNIEAHILAWEAYQKALSGIKVLDPACGSGAFLNEVFDYLYREGQAINSQLTTLRGGQFALFKWDTHILANNLYGVDVNQESVEITKLSLWLKTANRSEKLTYLDDNVQFGNSLIDDPTIAGTAAFNWQEKFSSIDAAGGFDVIVGNPPYVLSRDNTLDEMKDYARNHYELYSDKINLYMLFMEKSLSLLTKNGYLSFIIPNSFLGISSAMKCRQHITKATQIKSVVNILGSTFKGVSVEALVFCLKKIQPQANQVGVATISRARQLDEPLVTIPQASWLQSENTIFDLKSADADFRLLQKLEKFPKLSVKYSARAGLQAYEKGKGIPKQTEADVKSHPYDYKFKFDASTHRYFEGGDVGRYSTSWSGQWLRWGEWLSQPREFSLFSTPRILIREITGRYPRVLMCAYVSETYLNNKSIINVIPKSEGANLHYLLAVMNSKVVSFYHTRRAVKGNRKLFPKAVVSDISNYPIPVPSDAVQKLLANYAVSMIAKQQELRTVAQAFVTLIQTEFGFKNAPAKLLNWHDCDFPDFIATLKTMKVSLTLAQRAEWLPLFEAKRSAARVIGGQIASLDKDIDLAIYDLYGLTAAEIELVESGDLEKP